jgi:hemerythrin
MDRYDNPFALGVASMDAEHRRLAELFQAFRASLKHEGVSEGTREIVAEALAAANAHFESEEALMVAHDYPGLDEEQMHHRNLRLQLTTLVGDALTSGMYDATTEENLATMERLLFEHINGPDRTLAHFLNVRGVH